MNRSKNLCSLGKLEIEADNCYNANIEIQNELDDLDQEIENKEQEYATKHQLLQYLQNQLHFQKQIHEEKRLGNDDNNYLNISSLT